MRQTYRGIGSQIDNPDYWVVTRDTKLPRGTFDANRWENIGHQIAPVAVILALLLALLAIWASAP